MGSSSTVYDVRIKYALDDKASGGASGMARQFDKANTSASNLKGTLIAIAAAATGAFVLGKRSLVDYNSEIDQARIGMTTIMTMQLKKPWDEASKSADKLFNKFQDLAKKSPATTKDFIEMGNALTPMIAMMGGDTDKIAKLTQGTITAALATGTRSDVAALDVKQMLAGTVSMRDMMANQLLSAGGIDKTAFNAMGGAARAAMTEKLLSDPALLRAADEFGKSFAGQVSTFQDQLQIALGTVGRPLMVAMTAEVQKWNNWIEKHPKTIARISAQLGDMVKRSFTFIKSAAGFLVDNRDTIFAIGKLFLIFKGTQMAQGLIGGFVSGIRNFTDIIKNSGNGFKGVMDGSKGLIAGIGAVGKSALMAAPQIALLGAVAWEVGGRLNDWLTGDDDRKKKNRQTASGLNDLDESLGEVTTWSKRLKEIDERDKAGKLTPEMKTERYNLQSHFSDPAIMGPIIRNLDDQYRKLNPKAQNSLRDMGYQEFSNNGNGVINLVKDMQTNAWVDGTTSVDAAVKFANLTDAIKSLDTNMSLFNRGEIYQQAFPDQFAPQSVGTDDTSKGWKDPLAGAAAKVNVTIQKIEVASDDPDRFVFGMVQSFKKIASNPTQAASALGD